MESRDTCHTHEKVITIALIQKLLGHFCMVVGLERGKVEPKAVEWGGGGAFFLSTLYA